MQGFLLDLWNGLVQQPWLVRAAIGAVLGAIVFVVVPPLVGKKGVTTAIGGDGGSAEIGRDGLAVGGVGRQVAGQDAHGQGGAGGAARVGGKGVAIGGAGGRVADR